MSIFEYRNEKNKITALGTSLDVETVTAARRPACVTLPLSHLVINSNPEDAPN